MKINREKIIGILTAIKETCQENDCDTCPLSNQGTCLIPGGSIPEDWNLNKLKGGK